MDISDLGGDAVKGNILAINTGSTTTKIGYFIDGRLAFEQKLEHSAEDISKFNYVMDQEPMRRKAILDFLKAKGIALTDIDLVMARGGLFTPVITGVYEVNEDMKETLISGRDGVHACNLSATIADAVVKAVNAEHAAKGDSPRYGICRAYVADPPMADEMLPECRICGLPEFRRITLFHALNSRAIVRRYLREHPGCGADFTAIVAHMGGGVTVSCHRGGTVIDTTNGVGGDGPMTPERAGTCPPNQLVEMCFSGRYTKDQIMKKLVGKGGAVAYFGTNDMRTIEEKAIAGEHDYVMFTEAFCLNIAKAIAAESATVSGKVDAVILTGGIAYSRFITEKIAARVRHIAPVTIYPGEDELSSLAENGYLVLAGKAKIHTYAKDRIIED